MDLTQLHCDEILAKLLTGVPTETLAEEYDVSTGIIDIIRLGKLQLEDGSAQKPIEKRKMTSSNSPNRLKCTPFEIDEMCERFKYGDTIPSIAEDFNISLNTVQRYLDIRQVIRGTYAGRAPEGALKVVNEFLRKARIILFRAIPGQKGKLFHEWEAEVQRLFQTGKYSKKESMVLATKKFEICNKLFEEYDVSEYDPEAKKKDSTNDTPFGDGKDEVQQSIQPNEARLETNQKDRESSGEGIICEDKELSYRENLAWAIKTVGNERRTGIPPDTCPNDTAYWLYTQAKDGPKEFLSKLNAIEARNVGQDEEVGRRAAKRSIEDIDMMLSELVI